MKTYLLFFPLIELASSLLFITNTTLEFNENVGNATIILKDEPMVGTVISATFNTFVVIEKMILYLRINLQQDEKDKEYQKEMFRGVADIGKLMTGIIANPILKTFSSDIRKHMDFDPQFPWSKGTRKITNLEANGAFYPFLGTTKILINIRLVGKLEGSKKNDFLCNIKLFAELKR